MNIEELKLIEELVNALIWPTVVVIIILIFKKQIQSLISRITKVGYGDKYIEAEQEIDVKKQKKDNKKVPEVSKIDRVLNFFQPETINTFLQEVDKDTNIETFEEETQKIELLRKYASIIFLMLHFDRIYYLIFGSQIKILQQLNKLLPETRESLRIFYDEIKRSSVIFDNYSYEDYLNFLFSYSLIREDDGVVSLTILGSDFLKYLLDSNKSFNKLN